MTTSFSGLATVMLIVLLGNGCESKPNAKRLSDPDEARREAERAKLRDAYATVAKLIADEHRLDRTTVPPKLSPSRLIAEAKSLCAEMRRCDSGSDTDLKFVCEEAAAATEELIVATQNLERLPRPPGEFEQFLTGFFYGYTFNFSGASEYSNDIRKLEGSIQSEVIRLSQATERGHAATQLLPRVAKKLAGPNVTRAPIQADVDESWGGLSGGTDWLTLTNVSGQNLHNVTVVVELEGTSDGLRELHTNVHFFPHWQAGVSVQAKYDSGVTINGRKVACKTVSNIQNVNLAVYSDELSNTNYTFHYSVEEQNSDVTRYIDHCFAPRASFRSDNPFFHAAVKMDFAGSGLSYVRNVRATATIKRGALTKTVNSSNSDWKANENWEIEFPNTDWDATEAEVELTFNCNKGSGVTKTFHWKWNR